MSIVSQRGSTISGVLDLAVQLVEAGFSLLPIRIDGTKAPACNKWEHWQERRPTADELVTNFGGNVGIGLVCGTVSGNVEAIDFDRPGLFERFAEVAEQVVPGLVDGLTCHTTPRPGAHLLYRCDLVEGNEKLAYAMVPDSDGIERKKAIIETRGEGGYILLPGCPPRCHHSGGVYQYVAGPSLLDGGPPAITAEQRELLFTIARSFNEIIDEPKADPKLAPGTDRDGLSPGDDFAQKTDWGAILEPHGWVRVADRGDVALWRRPGKDHGVSATTGLRSQAGAELFCVFSSSAAPFEVPSGRTCGTFTKFAAYALLNHAGDFSEAARELARQGFGQKSLTMSQARAEYGTDGTGPRQQEPEHDANSSVPLATIRKVRLDMIEPETLQWLWLNRFAAGKVTLLAGDPGNGKSWLTMGLAATVSRGWLWPDQAPNCEPSNVVILSAEDGIKDTILPRLIKLGADRSKITAFEGIEFQTKKGTQQRTVNLGIDIPPVIQAIQEIGDVRLLIIDPVSSFLGTADQNKNGDVRGALQPLVEMAAATGMAVVMVTHLSKAAARSALSAATGSLAFGALARQAHLVCPDPDDPTGNKRLLLCMKSNICRKPAGLAFEIRDDSILWHADQVNISADEALRRASGPTSTNDRGKKGEAARALLRSLDLRNFSKPQAEIRQLAEEQGISYDTLHRAFKDMGGVAERGGFGGAVRWRIPADCPDLSAFEEWNQGAATV